MSEPGDDGARASRARRRLSAGLRSALKQLRQTVDQQGLRDSQELTNAAFELAASDAEDDPARRELERAIEAACPTGPQYALEGLAKGSESSVADRAHRLMVAATRREPVLPADPRRLELFEQLRDLHSKPVREAFDHLASFSRVLRRLAETVRPYPPDELEQVDWFKAETARARPYVGSHAADAAPLLRTRAAHQVVLAYLRIAAGNTDLGGFATSTREIQQARLREYERRGWTVERLPGGRTQMSVSHTFGVGPRH